VASIYKRTRRKPVPDGTTLKTFRGKQVAEWIDGRGDKQRASVSKDGKTVMVEAAFYTVEWFDHEGRRRRRGTRIVDKDAARQYANELEKQADQRRKGLIDARQERLAAESQRFLAEPLADFEAKMRAAGGSADHVKRTVRFVQTIAEVADFDTIGHITADGVNAYASDLSKRRSVRTVQAHLTAIKGFTRWLAREGKLPADPLASIKNPSPKADRRRERRMLLPEEWPWLRSVTLTEGVERYGMPAAERVLLYATAIQTGLRSCELRSLTRGRLFLDSTPPYVMCKARSTKNSKDARQYIQSDLASELQVHIATKAPKTRIFGMPRSEDMAKVLRADLANARQAWLKTTQHDPEETARRGESDFLAERNHEDEILDFHALRHTCGAWLAMTGAHPKAVQAVMRHSVITLTMDTYGHLFPGQEAETVARLPNMLTNPADAMHATGTADARPHYRSEKWAHFGAQLNGKTRPRVATHSEKAGVTESDVPTDEPEPQVYTMTADSKSQQPAATADMNGRDGTRTHTPSYGHGILNPERLPIPPLGRGV